MKNLLHPAPICAGLAFLAPVMSIYLPLSLASLVVIAAVLMTAGWVAGSRPMFCAIPSLLALVAGLAVLTGLSGLWSINPDEAFAKMPRLVMIFSAGCLVLCGAVALDDERRAALGRWTISGLLLAVAMLVLERTTGGVLFSFYGVPEGGASFLNLFNRGLTICAILAWPAILCAARIRPIYGILIFGLMFGVLLAFKTNAAIAAMVLGGLVFVLVGVSPSTIGRLLPPVLGLVLFTAPLVHNYLPSPKDLFEAASLPRSTYHRLLIWDFASNRIAERPLLGWGFNSSRVIPGHDRQLDVSEVAMPLHPHNGALQLWLELGIGGALLGAGLVAAAAEGARRYSRGRLEQAAASATVAAALVVVMVSYGLWQSWWMSALFIAAASAIVACGRRPSGRTV